MESQGMEQEAAALGILAKRSFDRSAAEAQQLATWLVSNCSPFFSSMRQDVVEHLCTYVGHASVDDSQPVYTQGQVGDCMYIVVKGYCTLLKHAGPASTSSSTTHATGPAAAPAGLDGGNPSTSPSSRHSTSSHPVSRRATIEQQAQQFALATGTVGPSTGSMPPGTAAGILAGNSRRATADAPRASGAVGPAGTSSRRGTAELPGLAGHHTFPAAGSAAVLSGVAQSIGGFGSSPGSSRRVTGAGAAGSRRVTSEQVVQQRLAESTQLGLLSPGDGFGESALVNPAQQRPVSVVAGVGGATLLVLDRACFHRLQQQAQEGQQLAAAAVQAVLAAACRPILRVGGRARTAEEVDTLAELLSGLEAFRCMPQQVRARLAKACQGLQLPSGGLVFEEDDKGDAMYVVVSGALQVRARPLQQAAAAQQQQQQQQQQQVPDSSAGTSPAPVLGHSSSGGSGSQLGVQASRRVRATTDAVCAGDGDSSSSGSGARGQLLGGGPRCATWEGVAFTAKEQSRLAAAQAAVETDKLQAGSVAVTDTGSSRAQQVNMVERDGLYWTAKFMSDATAAATACEPEWSLEGGMTPLAAVFASKWRQQVRQQAVQHHAQAAAAEEEAADSKAYAAMEEMLGKAAARSWKTARGNAASLAGAAAAGGMPQASSHSPKAATAGASISNTASASYAPLSLPGAGADERAVAAATVVAGESDAPSPDGSAPASSTSSSPGASAAEAEASEASQLVPCTPRTAAAAAAQLLAAAAAATDPAEAVKLHLAALGVKDPADVSRSLMAELGARSNLEGLLAAVAEFLQRRGLPRRLNKKTSLKITRELNKRMLAGASWKGYGSGSSSQGSSFQRRHADADGSSAAAARGDGGCEAAGGELGSEATGLSSCDWQSSLQLDASDGASMGDGLGMEDSWDGSVLDGIDLAGEGAEASFAQQGTAEQQQQQQQQQQTTGPGCAPGMAGQQQQQQSAAPSLRAVPLVRADAPSDPATDGCCLTAQFGPVIRQLGTGDSFGELALLQSSATRTATVLVAPDTASSFTARGQQGTGGAAAAGALLIKISRSCYDATVRALQVSALEDLLGFLSSLPAFHALSREALTSLAVFIKPASVTPGQVLAVAGQATDALIVIQSGEVKLLAQHGHSSSPTSSPHVLSRDSSGGHGTSANNSNSGSTAQQPRSRRSTGTQPSPSSILQAGQPGSSGNGGSGSGSGSFGSSGGSRGGVGGTGVALGVQLTPQQQLAGVQLAVLGPGSLLGENVLGYDPDEDPVAAIAAAPTRQAAQAAAAGLTHAATAVAASPCKLLVLSADDLRRFGRRVRGPLAEAAAVRRDWLQQRLAAVQVPVGMQGMLPSLGSASGASEGTTGGFSRGLRAGAQAQGSAAGRSAVGSAGRVGSNNGSSRSGNSNGSGGIWPGLAGLLNPGSSAAVVAAAAKLQRSSPGAAAAASRCQWQQQQWQQGAYGELMQRAPQLPTQQQLRVCDVARMRQVVPGMQAPCVSELAAATRPFPSGLLTASAVATAGRDGAAGLKLLLGDTLQQQLLGGSQATAGSPKWAVGAGGRVQPAGGLGAAAVDTVPASGRRGALGKHLELGHDS